MAEPNVLESLPDRALERSEVHAIGESDAVDWVETLMDGPPIRPNQISAWLLEANGTAYVLLYELDGWVSKGSFDTEGMDAEEKRERGEEILDF